MNSFDLIRLINEREIGKTSYREVEMLLGSVGKSEIHPSRTISLKTLRVNNGEISRTFFCATTPFYFKNISFLLTEVKGYLLPFDIKLYLPFGLHLIRKIDEKRRFQEVLGSDFTYDDLKTWLYVEGQNYILTCEATDDILSIQNAPETSRFIKYRNWKKQELLVKNNTFLISQCKFYKSTSDSQPFKVLSFFDYFKVNGIFIHKKMKMINYDLNHETTIRLKDCWFDKPVDELIFIEENFSKLLAFTTKV